MTTEEKLNAIVAKCREFLEEKAAKRTPGEWKVTDGVYDYSPEASQFPEGPSIRLSGKDDILFNLGQERNAAFIAACAGQAEAMARSTIVAIEWLQAMIALIAEADPHCPHHSAMQPHITKILTAWPEELLCHKKNSNI